jgi:hypothetical protein
MRSISRRSVFAVPTVLLLVFAAGCADSDDNSVASSQISIALSASSEASETTSDGGPVEPGEVTAAVVTIERIYLVGGGGTDDEDDHDHADVEGAASGASASDGSAGDGSASDGSAGDDAGRVADAGGNALADAATDAGSVPDDQKDSGMPSVSKGARHGKGKGQRSEGHGHGGSVVLLDDPVTMELFELEAFAGDLVDRATVSPGRYPQLRFVISGGYIDVSGEGIYATSGYAVPEGETVIGELRMPSYSTSGFKVLLPSGSVSLAGGEHLALRVHFDVAESFGKGTGSGDWIMRPTLRATDAM